MTEGRDAFSSIGRRDSPQKRSLQPHQFRIISCPRIKIERFPTRTTSKRTGWPQMPAASSVLRDLPKRCRCNVRPNPRRPGKNWTSVQSKRTAHFPSWGILDDCPHRISYHDGRSQKIAPKEKKFRLHQRIFGDPRIKNCWWESYPHLSLKTQANKIKNLRVWLPSVEGHVRAKAITKF